MTANDMYFLMDRIRRLEHLAGKACENIERADARLLAVDGPCGDSPPDMSLTEWRELYETVVAARRLAGRSVVDANAILGRHKRVYRMKNHDVSKV